MMPRPCASLSLDLDNAWSYLKTRGDDAWTAMPSYFETVVPRFLAINRDLGLPLSVFIVGADAAIEANRPWLREIADAGCEIGNHSFNHEPWLHLYSAEETAAEIIRAEEAIQAATGVRPRGFRGPGFSVSAQVLETLAARRYLYDASTFPTVIGPLARLYYFMKAPLSREDRKTRDRLFGRISDGFRPLRPYRWSTHEGGLVEIPVTTMPLLRVPFHLSYLHYLAGYSPALARGYFRAGLAACRLRGVEPSFLLHPLDYLGAGEFPGLDFFPAMNQPAEQKLELARWALETLAGHFEVVTMREHAERASARDLPTVQPRLLAQPA
ncbi:MAG: polysaccharide deacetylase family protein [Rhodobiaceae bacterium]|nr:polysaccharide deacetylase family protein [Rhodobiaceae bacterium]MCC0015016.1 polysaccharide deacetylase family protein [Rhodobiaceae bacterium]MCC0052976.1 polysaccharide deacetylase family protein [Rhodobiaceae bacterium]